MGDVVPLNSGSVIKGVLDAEFPRGRVVNEAGIEEGGGLEVEVEGWASWSGRTS